MPFRSPCKQKTQKELSLWVIDLLRLHFLQNYEPGWIRTIDTRLKRAVLYQLSYGPTNFAQRF